MSSFMPSGKTPCVKERLQICKRGCNMMEDDDLMCWASNSSYPTALCFKHLITCSNSSGETVSRNIEFTIWFFMYLEGEMGELGMRLANSEPTLTKKLLNEFAILWSSVIVSLLWIIILLETPPLLLFKIRLITLHVFCMLFLYPLNRSW